MKEFSTKWKASKNPSKQRKFLAKAPLHIKRKFLSTNLSKELKEKYNIRNIQLKKGDTVKVLVGKFKDKKGKISKVKTKQMKIYIDGIQKKKQDGSMVDIPFKTANLQITELELSDKRRFKNLKNEPKTETTKKEEKPEIKKDKQSKEKKE